MSVLKRFQYHLLNGRKFLHSQVRYTHITLATQYLDVYTSHVHPQTSHVHTPHIQAIYAYTETFQHHLNANKM